MATGRRTVVVGQTIDPDVWGNPLWDQSVQSFATAADRTAQFPAPLLGAVTWLDDVKALEVWTGGVWSRVITQLGIAQGPPALVLLPVAPTNVAGLVINTVTGGPVNLLVTWDVQLVNQNSGAIREAIVNVAVDGNYAGNGSRQLSLPNNGWANMSGTAVVTLTAGPHVITVQARSSAAGAVGLSDGSMRVVTR